MIYFSKNNRMIHFMIKNLMVYTAGVSKRHFQTRKKHEYTTKMMKICKKVQNCAKRYNLWCTIFYYGGAHFI